MNMRLVQLQRAATRCVAIVSGGQLVPLDGIATIYALASKALQNGEPLTRMAEDLAGQNSFDYDSVYAGASDWRILPSIDHPADPARCLVAGTGLTHKASVDNRSAMHEQGAANVTDSMRMYQLGLEGGRPVDGAIGVQPEWFYKGNGSILRAHNEPLRIPPYAEDGGEEPEIAGVYLIAPSGDAFRVGLTMANEFSDHKMEKRNYLYLAPSKLRNCSIGPELVIGAFPFEDVSGFVRIERNNQELWSKAIRTGQKNMCHSVQNLEHHHFKYESHRRPDDVHVHFFGADAFSFGAGLTLAEGDWMEVSFSGFGRPLRNPLTVASSPEPLVTVRTL